MVLMTLKIRLKKYQTSSSPRLKYDLKKLKDTNVLEVFQARLGGRFALLMPLTDLDELEESFTREINAAAKEILGRKTNIKQPWITENTLNDLKDWTNMGSITLWNTNPQISTNVENSEQRMKNGSTLNARHLKIILGAIIQRKHSLLSRI